MAAGVPYRHRGSARVGLLYRDTSTHIREAPPRRGQKSTLPFTPAIANPVCRWLREDGNNWTLRQPVGHVPVHSPARLLLWIAGKLTILAGNKAGAGALALHRHLDGAGSSSVLFRELSYVWPWQLRKILGRRSVRITRLKDYIPTVTLAPYYHARKHEIP